MDDLPVIRPIEWFVDRRLRKLSDHSRNGDRFAPIFLSCLGPGSNGAEDRVWRDGKTVGRLQHELQPKIPAMPVVHIVRTRRDPLESGAL